MGGGRRRWCRVWAGVDSPILYLSMFFCLVFFGHFFVILSKAVLKVSTFN